MFLDNSNALSQKEAEDTKTKIQGSRGKERPTHDTKHINKNTQLQ